MKVNAMASDLTSVTFKPSSVSHDVTSDDVGKSYLIEPVLAAEELKVGNPFNASFATTMAVNSIVPWSY
jgi:hypothetical protein